MKLTKDRVRNNFIKMLSLVLVFVLAFQINTMAAKKKFSISNTELTLSRGTSQTLRVSNLPVKDGKVKWKTSNKFAVKVNSSGKVTAQKCGTAKITATCEGQSVYCYITVPDASKIVSLNASSVTIKEGTTYQLVAASTGGVTYHSCNGHIATVDSKGLVTARQPGIVTIVAKSKTGFAKCTFTVLSNDTPVKVSSWL